MFTVYVLLSSSTGNLYIGQTENLSRRLTEHRTNMARYTRGRGPWKLVFAEEYTSRAQAMRRERSLKSGQGRQSIKVALLVTAHTSCKATSTLATASQELNVLPLSSALRRPCRK